MAKAEIEPGVIGPSEEEIKSLTGKGADSNSSGDRIWSNISICQGVSFTFLL